MLSFYARVFLTYTPLLGLKGFLSLFFIVRFLESNWFVWVTQMNHIPMHIDHDRNVDWVSTQVRDSHLEDLDMPQLLKRVGAGQK